MKRFLILAGLALALVACSPAHAQTYQTQCPQGSSVNSWGSARNGPTGAILQNYCTDTNGNAILNFPVTAPATPQQIIVGTMPGADTGAQINACDLYWTSHGFFGGTCVLAGDLKPLGAPEIVTPVSMVNDTVLTGCAQTIMVDVPIPLIGSQGVEGCVGGSLSFSKNGNTDVFTVSNSGNVISNIEIFGNNSTPFTGNGITADNTSDQTLISGVTSLGNDTEVFLNGANHVTIEKSVLEGYTNHALDCSGCDALLTTSTVTGFGDETSSTVFVHGNANFAAVSNLLIENRNGFPAIDALSESNAVTISGNKEIISPTGIGISTAGDGEITGNNIVGTTALNVVGGTGSATGNTLTGIGAGTSAVVISGANLFSFSSNTVSFTDSVGGACGVKITGDTIGVQLSRVSVTIGPGAAADYGGCIVTTSGHMLGIKVDGLQANGVGAPSGSSTFFLNNAGGLNNNWGVQIRNIGCTHLTNLLKRTDAQNNVTVYDGLDNGDCAVDAGTGSTADQFTITGVIAFAALPSPAGNGSIVRTCSNCTQAKPTTNAGAGAFVVREAGQWNGL